MPKTVGISSAGKLDTLKVLENKNNLIPVSRYVYFF